MISLRGFGRLSISDLARSDRAKIAKQQNKHLTCKLWRLALPGALFDIGRHWPALAVTPSAVFWNPNDA
jgi:hypothetical protein